MGVIRNFMELGGFWEEGNECFVGFGVGVEIFTRLLILAYIGI